MSSVRAANDCDSFLSCCETGKNCRQFYLGGIVGADFGTLAKVSGVSAVPNDSLFTAGGTIGVRSLRGNGAWRFEFEGRGREQIQDRVIDPSAGIDITTAARDGWSTMVNIWRDYNVIGDVDLYAGGGIGAGGYRSVFNATQIDPTIASNENVSSFAWQAGGGLIYNISNRLAVDLGYRFFSINDMTANGISLIDGTPFTYPTNYGASELLLTVRIYEPFRRWR